jgi:Holliday junction resolvase RusA-like endonuclease
MIFTRINIKPLSVNRAFKGRRFKTKEYKDYEKELLLRLKPFNMPSSPYQIDYIFGFSNKASDIDNGIKQFQDILCKKYNFDDKDIYKITVKKEVVKKGGEFIDFQINYYGE